MGDNHKFDYFENLLLIYFLSNLVCVVERKSRIVFNNNFFFREYSTYRVATTSRLKAPRHLVVLS